MVLGVTLAPKQVIVKEFPTPVPGAGEVRVRVEASAICRTDLTLYHGASAFNTDNLVIVGHEPAGVVDQVGPGVTNVNEGDRVAIYLAVGCGHCTYCRAGFLMHCKRWECIGFHRHGGDAEYIVVPAANCLPIPKELDFVAAAVSLDVVGTLFNAQKRLDVSGRDTVAIFGMGPMGLGGVMVAKAFGARVIAVDVMPARLELAKAVGADAVIDAGQGDAPEQIWEMTGRGAAVTIDCSGNPRGQNDSLRSAAVFGRVAWIGASTQTTINPREMFTRKQLTLIGSWYFNIADYPEITDLIVRNRMPLERLVTHRFSLEEAEEAFTLFDQRQTGKVVFLPWQKASASEPAHGQ